MQLFKPSERDELTQSLVALEERLAKIEAILNEIFEAYVLRGQVRETYSTTEAAKALGKSPYTVREWCRLGRVHAIRAKSGRGHDPEWRITHDELRRIQREGLLPFSRMRVAG